jgi:PAS domain S-box-containing protein
VNSVEEPLGESAGDRLRTRPITSVLDAVLVLGADETVLEFSPAAEELFGIARAEAVGRDLVELIVPPELREGVRYCLAGGEGEPPQVAGELLGRRIEMPAHRGDGGEFRVELTIVRAPEEGRGPTVFARDVSHRAEVERTRAHMALVVSGTQDAVLSKDLEGIVTTWNPAAERLYGYSAEEAVGRHVSFLTPNELQHELHDILARVRRGENLETYETRRVRKDGAEIYVSLTISPIAGPGGVYGISVIARDITSERRRRRARDFLIAATRDLDASLDPAETARNIVAKAVPDLAEVCIIDFIRGDGLIGDSVAASAIPGAAERLERIRRDSPLDPAGNHPVAQVLREGEPMLWRDLKEPEVAEAVAQTAEHQALIDDAGYESAAVVALIARGRKLGALSFLHSEGNVRYEDGDLEFLGELGERAALALDNAQLYQERDAIARNLQRGLRPPRPARVEGLQSAVVFEAAGRGIEIGGDLYDVLPTEDGCWVLIGDVAGKGSAAAGVSVAVRHAVRGLTREVDEPEEVLGRVNELLLEGTGLNDFATAVLVRLREADGDWTLAAASAGHPPPVHVHKGGARLLGGGTVLGALQDAKVQRHDATFARGDTLVFCTDGWLEAGPPSEHRDPLELAQLAEYLAPLALEEMLARMRGDAISRSYGELRDDVVLLALRRV